MKQALTNKQIEELTNKIYLLLIEDNNDMGEMGNCMEAADSLVMEWIRENDIETIIEEEPALFESKHIEIEEDQTTIYFDGKPFFSWNVEEMSEDELAPMAMANAIHLFNTDPNKLYKSYFKFHHQ